MVDSGKRQKMMLRIAEVDLDQVKLGETDSLLSFESREELHSALAAMIGSARHGVRYLGNRFDSEVLGRGDVPTEIGRFLRRNHLATFQTLVVSSQQLVQSGNRLVELLRDNMPQVECRIRRFASSSEGSFTGSFVLVDDVGYVFLPNPEKIFGSASFYSPGTADTFADVFNEGWRVADTDAAMQPLFI